MAELKVGRITLGMCQTNFYFIYREGAKEVIAIDPADRGAYLYEKLKENGFSVEAILLTHGHFDHIWGVEELKELSGAKVYAYEGERKLLGNAGMNVSKGAGRPVTLTADEFLTDNQEVCIADMRVKVLATPGHTEGSCCYFFEEAAILISGDTLFEESVGRTDLPTGNYSELIRSVTEKLMPLPDHTKVYPGHGDQTTIAHERDYNPFLVM